MPARMYIMKVSPRLSRSARSRLAIALYRNVYHGISPQSDVGEGKVLTFTLFIHNRVSADDLRLLTHFFAKATTADTFFTYSINLLRNLKNPKSVRCVSKPIPEDDYSEDDSCAQRTFE